MKLADSYGDRYWENKSNYYQSFILILLSIYLFR